MEDPRFKTNGPPNLLLLEKERADRSRQDKQSNKASNSPHPREQDLWGIGVIPIIGRTYAGFLRWITLDKLPGWDGPKRERPFSLCSYSVFTEPAKFAHAYHKVRTIIWECGVRPETILAPVRITPLARTSQASQQFIGQLYYLDVDVVAGPPLAESEPGKFDWVDYQVPLIAYLWG